jgi:hypothetical protein
LEVMKPRPRARERVRRGAMSGWREPGGVSYLGAECSDVSRV